MVKNEEDVLEETLRNLVGQGVDRILVADNGSTDFTPALLRRLAEELPLSFVHDPIPHLCQGDKTSHLARTATRLGASWIVPFDADEIWKGTDGMTIIGVLRTSDTDIAEADWWNYMPLAVADGQTWQARYPYRQREPDPQIKVAFRANWLARLTPGNHSVSVPGGRHGRALRIAHYRCKDEVAAEEVLRQLATSGELVHDPAHLW